MASIAKEKKKKFSVLFIDWEAQYNLTIGHVRTMEELYTRPSEAHSGQYLWSSGIALTSR